MNEGNALHLDLKKKNEENSRPAAGNREKQQGKKKQCVSGVRGVDELNKTLEEKRNFSSNLLHSVSIVISKVS